MGAAGSGGRAKGSLRPRSFTMDATGEWVEAGGPDAYPEWVLELGGGRELRLRVIQRLRSRSERGVPEWRWTTAMSYEARP